MGNENKPLVILGDSGSGKSALLANWVARYPALPATAVLSSSEVKSIKVMALMTRARIEPAACGLKVSPRVGTIGRDRREQARRTGFGGGVVPARAPRFPYG